MAWQQAQAGLGVWRHRAGLETMQEAERLKTCLTNRIYESSQASKGKQPAIKQTRQRRRAMGCWRSCPLLLLVTNLKAVALVESHREAGVYLPNWCAQMAKRASPEILSALKRAAYKREQVGRQDWSPGKYSGSCWTMWCVGPCWGVISFSFILAVATFITAAGLNHVSGCFFPLSASTFSLRVQLQHVLYFFSFI